MAAAGGVAPERNAERAPAPAAMLPAVAAPGLALAARAGLAELLPMVVEAIFRCSGASHVLCCLRDARTDALSGRFGRGDAVAAMVQQAMDAWGRVDILVNNAGVSQSHRLMDSSQADYDVVMLLDL